MRANGIKRFFNKASGERLAAAAVLFIALNSVGSAMENWTLNYTSFYLNESVPFQQVIDANSETITFLLLVIASCQVFQCLTKVMGWFLNDYD